MASQREQVELFIRVLGREQLQLAARDVAQLSQSLAAISSQVAAVSGRLRSAVAAMQAGLVPLQRFDKAFAAALAAPSIGNLRNLKRAAEEAFSAFDEERFQEFGVAAEEGIKAFLDATIEARSRVRDLAKAVPRDLLRAQMVEEGGRKFLQPAPGALPLQIQNLVLAMRDLERISPQSVLRVVEGLREVGAEDIAQEWEDAFVRLQTAVVSGMGQARLALLDLQPVAQNLSSFISGVAAGLPREMQQPLALVSRELERLNREILKGSVTVGSFDRAISAANTVLELLGQSTVRETEAVAQLRNSLASVRDVLLGYRNALAQANEELQAQEQLARRQVSRTPEEGRRIKVLQSVLQGLIIGYSALQGQLLFTAFSLVFIEHAIIRIALVTAAAVMAIEGLRRAFTAVARAAVSAASQLEDLRLQFLALTRDVGQAQAAIDLAADIATRFGFAIGDVAQGLLELRREGLLTAETIKAVGNLAAATGMSYAEAAKLFTQAVGRQVGSMESLFDVGIRIPGMFEKTEEAQRGVLNELGRLQRMQIAAQAINERFAGAMERRMGTLTGVWQALRSAVQQFFALIGQPIIQDMLVPALRELLRFVGLVVRALREFMASAEFQRMWAQTLQNFRDALRMLFPDQERYTNQVRVIIFFVKLFFQLLLLTSQAAVIFAKAIRAAGRALEFLGTVLKPVLALLRALLGLLKDLILGLLGLKDLDLSGFFRVLAEILDALIRRRLPDLLRFLDDLLSGLRRLLSALDEFLGRLLRSLRSLLDDLAQRVLRTLARLVDDVMGRLRRLGSALEEVVIALVRFAFFSGSTARRIAELSGLFDELSQRTRILRSLMDDLTQVLIDRLPRLRSAIDELGGAWAKLSDNLASRLRRAFAETDVRKVLDDARKLGDDLARAIEEGFSPRKVNVGALIESIDEISQNLDELTRSLADLDRQRRLAELADEGESATGVFRSLRSAMDDLGQAIARNLPFKERLRAAFRGIREAVSGVDWMGMVVGLEESLRLALRKIDEFLPNLKRVIKLPFDLAATILDPTQLIRLPARIVDLLGEAISTGITQALRVGIRTAMSALPKGPGELMLFVFDVLGAIFIAAFGPKNPVWQSVAQILKDVIIEVIGMALAGAAAGTAAGGPVGTLAGAIIGALLGILISVATELGLNPQFREAFFGFGRKMIDWMIDGLRTHWQELVSVLTLLFTGPLGFVTLFATDAFGLRTAIFNFLKSILDPFQDALDWIADRFKPADVVRDALHAVGEAIADAAEFVGGAFEDMFSFLGDRLGDMLEFIGRLFKDLGEGIGDALGGLGGKIPLVGDMADALKNMGEAVLGAADKVRDFGGTVGMVVPKASSDVSRASVDIDKYMKDIQKSVKDTGRSWDEIFPKPKETFDEWRKRIEEFVRNAQEFESNLKLIHQELAKSNAQMADQIVAQIARKGPEYVAQVAKYFKDDPEQAVKLFADAAPYLASNWAEEATKRIIQSGPGYAEAIAQSITKHIESVPGQKVTEFLATAPKLAGQVADVLMELGRVPPERITEFFAQAPTLRSAIGSILYEIFRVPPERVTEFFAQAPGMASAVGMILMELARVPDQKMVQIILDTSSALIAAQRFAEELARYGIDLRTSPGTLGIGVQPYQRGGRNVPGGIALVGERGPELVFLPRGATIWPNNMTEAFLTGAALASAGAPATVINVYVDASNSQFIGDDEFAERVMAKVDETIRRRLGVSALAVTRR